MLGFQGGGADNYSNSAWVQLDLRPTGPWSLGERAWYTLRAHAHQLFHDSWSYFYSDLYTRLPAYVQLYRQYTDEYTMIVEFPRFFQSMCTQRAFSPPQTAKVFWYSFINQLAIASYLLIELWHAHNEWFELYTYNCITNLATVVSKIMPCLYFLAKMLHAQLYIATYVIACYRVG